MSREGESGADGAARAEQWEADRVVEATPLPYAGQSHYRNPGERQIDLEAAEKSNVAQAAGELGLTSDEYLALRKVVGHNPGQEDVERAR